MKNIFLLLLILLIVIFTNLNANLIELYKKGTIKLEPDPDFGKGVEWDSLFFDERKEIIVASDGSIFVASSPTHNIFKFNNQGALIGTYGRKGNGPGDLYHPHCHSILDGKFLVIGEYALKRRISIFDFSGKCVKVLKTNHSCFGAVALKNNHVAYYTQKGGPGTKKGEFFNRASIIINNMNTGKEIQIDSYKLTSRHILLETGGGIGTKFLGELYLHQTGDGNLLVGVSNSKDVKIYSPEGKLLKTFRLRMQPVPVTDDYFEETINSMLKSLQTSQMPSEIYKRLEKNIKKTVLNDLFGEYLPYYRQVLVDSEGNILFFKWLDCVGKANEVFQVYSPEGEFICETILDENIYAWELEPNFKTITFTDKGIFGIFKLDKEDDDHIRLVKVKVK